MDVGDHCPSKILIFISERIRDSTDVIRVTADNFDAGKLWRNLQRWKSEKRGRLAWSGKRSKEISKPARCITCSAQSRLVYLCLAAPMSHLDPSPDRDKVAGWIGHDLLKRYHKDTTSSSISCLCVGARRRCDWSVTEPHRGSRWGTGGKVPVSRVVHHTDNTARRP